MSVSGPPRATIVIRCFNEGEHIGRLLTGIMRQSLAPLEVILVDSGSTDETVAVASKFPVRIIPIKPQEFSFGHALNVGCEAATAELLVFASAHVYPLRTDWIENLLAPFSDAQVGLSYGRQLGNDVTKYSEGQIFAKWFPPLSDAHQQHYFCNNANAAIRRSLWRAFRYDATLTGLEDLDMAKRLHDAGHRIAYQADAAIVHVHDETWRQIYNRYRREAMALKRILPGEQFSVLDFLRLFSANVVSDLGHAAKTRVLRANALAIVMFRLMQFWGTYRGNNSRTLAAAELRERFYYPVELKRRGHDSHTDDDPAVIDYSAPDDARPPVAAASVQRRTAP